MQRTTDETSRSGSMNKEQGQQQQVPPPTATGSNRAAAAAAAATAASPERVGVPTDKPGGAGTGSGGNTNTNDKKNNESPYKNPFAGTVDWVETQEEPSIVRIASISSSQSMHRAALPAAVTAQRKEELLQQARQARLDWIWQVPLPYSSSSTDATRTILTPPGQADGLEEASAIWKQDERLNVILHALDKSVGNVSDSSRGAAGSTTTSTSSDSSRSNTLAVILSHLYGLNDPVAFAATTPQALADRLESLLGSDALEQLKDQRRQQLKNNQQQAKSMQQGHFNDTISALAGVSSVSPYWSDPALLSAYHDFLERLSDPAAAVVVTGMRNFLRNWMTTATTSEDKASTVSSTTTLQVACTKIRSYLQSTAEMLSQHPLWKKNHNKQQQQSRSPRTASATTTTTAQTQASTADDEEQRLMLRRCLDSFVYGHCRAFLQQLLHADATTTTTTTSEAEWQERLQCLQFVTARHLEIHCLQDYDNDDNNNNTTDSTTPTSSSMVQEWLRPAVTAIHSVHAHHAPIEKLQRLLAVYHAVNAALTTALNRTTTTANAETKAAGSASTDSSKSNKSASKLPSADDVLPTIIWTVLRAQPAHLLQDLKCVEEFLPAEQLRGEAGYAFTCMYGAVQFILDLKLEVPMSEDGNNDGGGEKPQLTTGTLSISPEEFRAGLASCKAMAQERLEQQKQKSQEQQYPTTIEAKMAAYAGDVDDLYNSILNHENLPDGVPVTTATNIPVHEIRAARLRGETIDLKWALHYSQKNEQRQAVPTIGQDLVVTTPSSSPDRRRQSSRRSGAGGPNDVPLVLPPGFSRQYTFLATRPETVTLADLPLLLEEYRTLVRTVETLLADRAKQQSLAQQAARRLQEQRVYEAVAQVGDVSWLPTQTSSTLSPTKLNAAASSDDGDDDNDPNRPVLPNPTLPVPQDEQQQQNGKE